MNLNKAKIVKKTENFRKDSRNLVANKNSSYVINSENQDQTLDQYFQKGIQDKVVGEYEGIDKYKQKIRELVGEKNYLQDALKTSEKEHQFLSQIISQFVDLNEILKIKNKSAYDEKQQMWNLPNFVIHQQKTVFPQLKKSTCNEIVQNEMKQRKIIFKQQTSECENFNDPENQFKELETFNSIEYRPLTSVSKYRQSSQGNRRRNNNNLN